MPKRSCEAAPLQSAARSINLLGQFDGICDADVHLLLCHRTGRMPIITTSPGAVDDILATMPIAELVDTLPGILTDAGHAPTTVAILATDIADLSRRFAALVDSDSVRIRLETITTDACRRFHADYVTARLICTYAGPATQWLDSADTAALVAGADTSSLTIRQIATGDVAIFKGRHWAPEPRIMHRSPPIAGRGEQRLVLVIDPAPLPEAPTRA